MSTHHPSLQTLTLNTTVPSRGRVSITATIHPQTDPRHDAMDLLFPSPSDGDPTLDECLDFPVLIAKVQAHDTAGYGAIFGWIQLVRSTDDEDVWKLDPIPVLDGLDTPFCYLGVEPTLFDAPMRGEKGEEVEWRAHAFLCVLGRCLLERRVGVVAGFEWGFRIVYPDRDRGVEGKREITVKELRSIDVAEWKEKLGVLKEKHGGWEFEDVKVLID